MIEDGLHFAQVRPRTGRVRPSVKPFVLYFLLYLYRCQKL